MRSRSGITPLVVAEMTRTGARREALGAGFGPLARYIHFTPGFLRRNEVLIDIETPANPAK
ncbi:hypothetical protein [Thiocapsa sp.]|uniref:hypothetical protein n=1 Tax=Thiocapsa sp. TaxID=2024551 RepID=UPI003593048A